MSSLDELNYALGVFGAEHFWANSQDWGSECSLQWSNTLPNLEFISVCGGIIPILVNVSVTPVILSRLFEFSPGGFQQQRYITASSAVSADIQRLSRFYKSSERAL